MADDDYVYIDLNSKQEVAAPEDEVFIDLNTGQQVTQPSYEAKDYYAGVGTGFKRGLANLPAHIGGDIVGGALGTLGEWTGFDSIRGASDYFREGGDMWRDMVDGNVGEGIIKPGSAADYAEMAPGFTADLAMQFATLNPLGVAARTGLINTGETFSNLRNQGVSSEQAANVAPIVGATGAAFSALPVGAYTNKALSPTLKALYGGGNVMLQNVGEEGLNITAERALTDKGVTGEEAVYRMGGAAAMTVPFAAGMGAGAWRARREFLRTPFDAGMGVEPNAMDIESALLVKELQQSEADSGFTPIDEKEMSIAARDAASHRGNQQKLAVTPETKTLELEDMMPDMAKQVQLEPEVQSKVILLDSSQEFQKPIAEKLDEATVVKDVKPAKPVDAPEPAPVEVNPESIQRAIEIDYAAQQAAAPLAPGQNPSRLVGQTDAVNSALNTAPEYVISKSEVGANPELMQFKDHADKKTGIFEAIKGKWNTQASKGMLFYEPIDPTDPKWGLAPGQRYLVVNGHHRLELANRSEDADMLFGSVIREADGVSVQSAKLMGAELNIRDNKGTPQDEARFFRDISRMAGAPAAIKRASELGVRSRNAQAIGIRSNDELFDAFARGRIPEQHAKAAAELRRVEETDPEVNSQVDEAQRRSLEAYLISKKPDKNGKVWELDPLAVKQVGLNYLDGARSGEQGEGEFKRTPKEIATEVELARLVSAEKRKISDELGAIRGDERLDSLPPEERARRIEEGRVPSTILDKTKVTNNRQKLFEKLAQLEKLNAFPELKAELLKKAKAEVGKKGYQADMFMPDEVEKPQTPPPHKPPVQLNDTQAQLEATRPKRKTRTKKGVVETVLSNEQGAIDLTALSQGVKIVKASVANMLSTKNNSLTLKSHQNPIDDYLTAPGIGAWRRNMTFFKTVADKFEGTPGGDGVSHAWKSTIKSFEDNHAIQYDSQEILDPFLRLGKDSADEKTVSNFVYTIADIQHSLGKQGRQTKQNLTDAELVKLGLRQDLIPAFRSVRDFYDKFAIEKIRQGLYARAGIDINSPTPPAPTQQLLPGATPVPPELTPRQMIDNYVDHLAATNNYAPFKRYGKYFVQVKPNKSKDALEYRTYESKAEMKRGEVEMRKKYGALGQGAFLSGQVKGTQNAAFEDMPAGLIDILTKRDPNNPQSADFSVRGIEALQTKKYIPGYNRDLGRAMRDYVIELANFVSRSELEYNFDKALKMTDKKTFADADGVGAPGAYTYIKKFKKDILETDDRYHQAVGKFASVYYLGAKGMTGIQNLTQTLTTTTPRLGKYYDGVSAKPEVVSARAYGQALSYLTTPKAFAKEYPELAKSLEAVKRNGWLDNSIANEFKSQNAAYDRALDTAMVLMSKTELYNKTHAAICAWNVIKDGKVKLKPDEQAGFIRDFINETQFIQGKIAKPAFYRNGLASTAFLFKNFAGNYLKLLRTSVNEKQYAELSRYLIYMTGTAGIYALPGLSYLVQGLEASGIYPKQELRKAFGEHEAAADVVSRGLASLVGMDWSGSVGLGDPAFAGEVGSMTPQEIALKMGSGPYGDILVRGQKFKKSLDQGNPIFPDSTNPRGAIEEILPVSAASQLKAYRASQEGYKTITGRPVYENPTAWELFQTAMGGQPLNVSKAYEQLGYEIKRADYVKRITEGESKRYAMAIYRGDHKKADEIRANLLKELRENLPNELKHTIPDKMRNLKAQLPRYLAEFRGHSKSKSKVNKVVERDSRKIYSRSALDGQ